MFSRGRILKSLAGCLLLLLGVALPWYGTRAQREDEIPNNELRVFTSEKGFRINATQKVMPEFPEEALRAGVQGVVVLSLYHDAAGDAAKIKVAQSPHSALTRAAIEAVEQWKWRQFRSGGIDRPVLSKLSFKFIIEKGVGRVEDAPDGGGPSASKDLFALRRTAVWPDDESRSRRAGRDKQD